MVMYGSFLNCIFTHKNNQKDVQKSFRMIVKNINLNKQKVSKCFCRQLSDVMICDPLECPFYKVQGSKFLDFDSKKQKKKFPIDFTSTHAKFKTFYTFPLINQATTINSHNLILGRKKNPYKILYVSIKKFIFSRTYFKTQKS